MKEKWKWLVDFFARLGKGFLAWRGIRTPESDDSDDIWDDGEPNSERK
jgi:hypothetical protein